MNMRHMKKKKVNKSVPVPVLPAKWRVVLTTMRLAVSAAFPSLDLWPCAWFCLVPFLFVIAGSGLRASFVSGVIFGFVHCRPCLVGVQCALCLHGSGTVGERAVHACHRRPARLVLRPVRDGCLRGYAVTHSLVRSAALLRSGMGVHGVYAREPVFRRAVGAFRLLPVPLACL